MRRPRAADYTMPCGAEQDTGVLRIRHLTKTFPGTRALDDVDLDIGTAEVHALVGQNGSEKSTLIKILEGYHHADADAGCVALFNGHRFDMTSRLGRARHEALRFVHQDLGLFPQMSAVDNLALRGEFFVDRFHRVQWEAQRNLSRDLLDRFGLDLDLNAPLSEATPVERTIVGIAAALFGWEFGSGLLILDEPTAVLPPSDVARLLRIVKEIRESGTSVLYVSHRLDEIFDIADRVTVLRGGRAVHTSPVCDLTPQGLAELMVGHEFDAPAGAPAAVAHGETPVLRARNLSGKFLDGVDIELREGEVLGLAGLPGSGRSELPYALVGALGSATGTMRFGAGAWVDARKSRSFNIPLVPADRAREAVVGNFTVGENMTLSVLDRISRLGHIRAKTERRVIEHWLESVEIKTDGPAAPITSLSGGNQQKVMIARCFARDPRVLVLCEPTAGVDVGTRRAIHEFISERANAGLSVVVSSSDISDLLAICTRIFVMAGGRAVRELVGDEITESALVRAMEEVDY